jgi:hypothetical protein
LYSPPRVHPRRLWHSDWRPSSDLLSDCRVVSEKKLDLTYFLIYSFIFKKHTQSKICSLFQMFSHFENKLMHRFLWDHF